MRKKLCSCSLTSVENSDSALRDVLSDLVTEIAAILLSQFANRYFYMELGRIDDSYILYSWDDDQDGSNLASFNWDTSNMCSHSTLEVDQTLRDWNLEIIKSSACYNLCVSSFMNSCQSGYSWSVKVILDSLNHFKQLALNPSEDRDLVIHGYVESCDWSSTFRWVDESFLVVFFASIAA